MSFSVIASTRFKKEAKRLSKKYTSLKEELADLDSIDDNTLKREIEAIK